VPSNKTKRRATKLFDLNAKPLTRDLRRPSKKTIRRVELGRIAVGAGGAGALAVGRIEPRRRRIALCGRLAAVRRDRRKRNADADSRT
jgi:hypothetical protein